MADDTDELAFQAGAAAVDSEPLGWPLVERRRGANAPPDGIERRGERESTYDVAPTLNAAPLWPFRIAALAGAVIRSINDYAWDNAPLLIATAAISIYTLVTCLRPLPYRNDNRTRLRIMLEMSLCTIVVLITGAWASPFALCLIPAAMLAGFAAGGVFSAQLAGAAVAAATLQHVPEVGVEVGLRDGVLWGGLLGLVAFTSGLAHRAARDAARQQQLALDRVSRLAEANSLLFALQRVAQSLPASLDLDEVLDTTVGRVRAMIEHDALVVYLKDQTTYQPIRSHTPQVAISFEQAELPRTLNDAIYSPKTVRIDHLTDGAGISEGARSGLYAGLRARGVLVGLIAVESRRPAAFTQQHAEIVHGLTEPFGIAIDNARMFRRIRTLGADEERTRIARDLHDHVGSSLAMIGFGVDRALSVDADNGEIRPVLEELRGQVTAVVADVRNTLSDLRTDVTETDSLAVVLRLFAERVAQRSGIECVTRISLAQRLPLQQERELWQIAREAITNVERHAHATTLTVTLGFNRGAIALAIIDDGVGLTATSPRVDSFGIMGMRERAARIGARISLHSPPSGGTELSVTINPQASR